MFGQTLVDFLAYSSFLPKFPFFAQNWPFSYNRLLSRFPSLSPHLRFCKTFDGFLPFSWKLPAANRPLLLSHLIFLPDFWWILAKFANFAKYVIFVRRTIIILGDPGADSGGEEKSKPAEKCDTKKSKERREEPLGTMSYQTSSKRSPPFCLLIGARKL